MKSSGFTLIEVMIVGAIVCILIAIGLTAWMGGNQAKTQCLGGFLFTNPAQLDYRHPVTPIQILDEQGHGIRCTEAR